jgi:ribonucleotide monophosphatase NagD (HAD superfamily)
VIVDVGDVRLYCAGAIAEAYAAAGGESFYYGKPHPPIYAMARDRLRAHLGGDVADDEILVVGDGLPTDILGAMGESLDAVFVTGGIAAEQTGTSPAGGPDPKRLRTVLEEARLSPAMAMAYVR